MVIIGGMGNIAGVILGAFVLSMIDRFVLPELNGVPDTIGLDFDVTAISGGIFGFLLLAMMVLRPEGFLPNRRRIELHEGEGHEAHEGETHDRARAARATTSSRRRSITKQFGGLIAVNDVDFARPAQGDRRRSSAPTAPARRRSSTA